VVQPTKCPPHGMVVQWSLTPGTAPQWFDLSFQFLTDHLHADTSAKHVTQWAAPPQS